MNKPLMQPDPDARSFSLAEVLWAIAAVLFALVVILH